MQLHLSTTKENILTGLLSGLWILILLPKTVQFAVYALILSVLVWNRKLVFPNGGVWILLGCIIQGLAILVQMMTQNPGIQRVFAAANTLLIWVIALLFYNLCTECIDQKALISKLAKAARVNLIVLFGLFLISLIYHQNTIHFAGLTYYLRRNDFLASGSTTRFCGLMETVLGPSHLFFICTPVLMLDNDMKLRRRNLLAALLGYICVVATHSRVGLVCCTVSMMVILYSYMTRKFGPNLKKTILFISTIILICIAFHYMATIMGELSDLFYLRGGSNSARFGIYEQSLQKMWSESPIIGIGIKYMLGGFPYGSHCTYIGLLYKSGILGTLCYLFGLYKIIKNTGSNIAGNGWHISAFFLILIYFAFLVFSDIDGSDWVIVSMFTTWGLLSTKEREKEDKQVSASEKITGKEVLALG